MELTIENPALLTAVSSLLMTIIWFVYLNIVMKQHRRTNRPFLIIHHAHDNDPDALCLFVNMSKEPVHIQCVLARVRQDGEVIDRYVTNFQPLPSDVTDIQSHLKQGPIQPGDYLVLGSFREIITGARSIGKDEGESKAETNDLKNVESLELCIAVIHGPSTFPIGARRRFFVRQEEGKTVLCAQSVYTEQLTKSKRKRTVRKWIEGRIAPVRTGSEENENTEQSRGDTDDQKE